MSAEELRALAGERLTQIALRDQAIASKDCELKSHQARIDQLTHEMAVLKRRKFKRSGEQLNAHQLSLLDETLDADIAAIKLERQALAPAPSAGGQARQQPKRATLAPIWRAWRFATNPTRASAPRRGATARSGAR